MLRTSCLLFCILVSSFSFFVSNLAAEQASSYAAFAQRILLQIEQQESSKDATCWTTVRMMEQFFTGAPLHTHASLLKIEASKLLIYKLWRKASLAAKTCEVQLAELESTLPSSLKGLSIDFSDPNSMRLNNPREIALLDYHKVTENWRLILSVLYEALAKQGLFSADSFNLKLLSWPSAERLAAAATVLTMRLLEEARLIAEQAGHHAVLPADIRNAYLKLIEQYQLSDRDLQLNMSAQSECARAFSSQSSAPLLVNTRNNINNKIKSLRAWNAPVWGSVAEEENIRKLLSRVAGKPITPKGFKYLLKRLLQTSADLARGELPVEANPLLLTQLSEWKLRDAPDDPKLLSVTWAFNALQHVFPVRTAVNGDVFVVSKPDNLIDSLAAKHDFAETRLIASDLDAVRDTSIHWYVMREVWSKSGALALDPFAAELMAERLSELTLFILKRATEIAEEYQQQLLGISVFENAFQVSFDRTLRLEDDLVWDKTLYDRRSKELKKYAPPLFADMSATSGIARRVCNTDIGYSKDYPLFEMLSEGAQIDLSKPQRVSDIQGSTGSGLAVADVNSDNLPDLFLAGEGCNRLYINQGDYRFKDQSESWGILDKHYDSHHPIFVDIDNDGLLDLFVTHREQPSRLFWQKEKGKFIDWTKASGITTKQGASAATFFDFDNDGLLDLFVGHYGISPPALYGLNAMPNQLYRNLGNGKFLDVSAASGMASRRWALASIAFDHNQDGLLDLFIANDFGFDELFINQGGGKFKNLAKQLRADDRGNGMNASVVDINHDGRFDLYVSVIDMFSKSFSFVLPQPDSLLEFDKRIQKSFFYIDENQLLVTQPDGRFVPQQRQYIEPGNRGWAWSANFFDYENDGDLDFYVANGFIEDSLAQQQANQLFISDARRLYHHTGAQVAAFKGNSRAVAALDLNNSGNSDLVVTNYQAAPVILKNLNKQKNSWIKLRLRGVQSNRNGIGASVRVFVKGQKPQLRQVTAGSHYLSQEDSTLMIGLGKAKSVERLEVLWPGGKKQIIKGPLAAGKTHLVSESTG